MLKVKNLSYAYKNKKVLENLSFELKPGSVLGLVGPNGSGKTTLITLLATNNKKLSKEIIHTIEEESLEIGYIPQEIALFSELTVLDNFRIFGKLNHVNNQLFKGIINALKLKDQLNMKVSKLSGGTKRRVNIGVELMRDPQFIYMDEPIVGIEYSIREQIVLLIQELSKEGKIILIASHNIDFLRKTCDQLLKLDQGRKVYFGAYNDDIL
jgi:ABC-2 type transport system ATP-binding protein